MDSTIRDAMFRDYRCILLSDCVAEPIGSELPRSNHEASVLAIQTILGWVSDSERFEPALRPTLQMKKVGRGLRPVLAKFCL